MDGKFLNCNVKRCLNTRLRVCVSVVKHLVHDDRFLCCGTSILSIVLFAMLLALVIIVQDYCFLLTIGLRLAHIGEIR